jgi:hypothetical protein
MEGFESELMPLEDVSNRGTLEELHNGIDFAGHVYLLFFYKLYTEYNFFV